MIFKGFTDENGNVIPVQGAGTVYNEEKNSLALGKDTAATGDNQFVFGRKNMLDFGVVSGATISFKPMEADTILYLIPEAIFTDKDSVEDYLKSNSISSVNGFFIPTGVNIHSYIVCTSNFAGTTKYYVALMYKSLSAYSTNDMFWLDEVTTSAVINYNQFVFISCSGIKETGAFAEIVGGGDDTDKRNIRTLAWDGTQWNAGDLTCDDGNGNTISMRDLLSRIATLEAAAAES